MSDDNTTNEPSVSIEEKVKMLSNWIGTINKDIDTIKLVRDAEFEEYRKIKEKYDGFLAKRYKIITRLDKRINERKRSIAEIEGEISNIQNRPPPGVLPPIEDIPKKVAKKKTVSEDVVPSVDLANVNIQLSDEEIRSLTTEIGK